MSALATMPDASRRRAIACAALIASPVDGEALAAVRGLQRTLDPLGLRIETLIEAALSPRRAPEPVPPRATSCDHRAAASWCLERDCWNERELSFLHSAATLACLSEKQRAWLGDLCNRAGWHL